MTTCKNCGNEIPKGYAFCGVCGTPIEVEVEEKWYYAKGETPVGPFNVQELSSMVQSNIINEDTLVWLEGTDQWIPFSQMMTSNNNQTQTEGWHYVVGEESVGPISEEELVSKRVSGEISEDTLVWNEQLPNWVPFEQTGLYTEQPIQWYYADGEEANGPWSQEDIVQKMNAGEIPVDTLLWNESLEGWVSVQETPMSDLVASVSQQPAEVQEETTEVEETSIEEPVDAPIEWYYADGEEANGPWSQEDIVQKMNAGEIPIDTLLWNESLEGWVSVQETPMSDLVASVSQQPAEVQEETTEVEETSIEESADVPVEWYYADGEEANGPWSQEDIVQKMNAGEIPIDTLLWNESLEGWVSVQETPMSDLVASVSQQPAEVQEETTEVEETSIEEPVDAPIEWYYADGEEANGPWSQEDIVQKMNAGEIPIDTLLWNESLEGWVSVQETPMSDLVASVSQQPAEVQEETTEVEETSIEESADVPVEWYYADGEEANGPWSQEDIVQKMNAGEIPIDTLLWNESLEGWVSVQETSMVDLVASISQQPMEEAEEISEENEEVEESIETKDSVEDVQESEEFQPLEFKEEQLDEPEDQSVTDIEWYYVSGEESVGPVSEHDLLSKRANKEITDETLIWNEKYSDWIALKDSTLADQVSVEDTPSNVEEDSVEQEWYVGISGESRGPFTQSDVVSMKNNQQIDENTLVWTPSLKDWITFGESVLAGVDTTKETIVKKIINEQKAQADSVVEEKEWFYAVDDSHQGPVTYSEIVALIQNHSLNEDSLLWKKGTPNWVELKTTEFNDYTPQVNVVANDKGFVATLKTNPLVKYGLITLLALTMLGVGFAVYNHQQNVKLEQELQQIEEENAKKAEEQKKAQEEAEKAAKAKAEAEAKQKEEEEKAKVVGAYVAVTDGLRRRSAPSVNSDKVGELNTGDEVYIKETIQDGAYLWGKTAAGNYVCIQEGSEVYLRKK